MNIPNQKFCHNCGMQTMINAKFCQGCGSSLTSIDSKPPVQPQAQATFVPRAMDANGENDDDDDRTIAADRIQSLSQLNLRMNGLEVDLGIPINNRETVASVAAQGQQLQGYKPTPRPTPPPMDSKAFIVQMQHDGGTQSWDPKLGH
jgi:hypothetical protein